ncbi:MAG: deoxyribose-phosphate aldolase [Firmicutes bacterium]|nr:deoxyribose-phosphate aldolase [Bacillota bacterium]
MSLLAGVIDHTQLAPTVTRTHIDRACREAVCYGFAAVCVSSRDVGQVAHRLSGSACKPCSTIGFPAGSAATVAKVAEARYAVSQGAQELDMVISLSDLVQGADDAVIADVRAVVEAAGATAVVKAIIETGLLTAEQQERAARLCAQAGAQFVKTSTGFAGTGATPEVVARLRAAVGARVGVKASGGIATRRQALALVAAGANRIGTSKGPEVVCSEGVSAW